MNLLTNLFFRNELKFSLFIAGKQKKKHPKQTEKPLYHSSDLTDDQVCHGSVQGGSTAIWAPLGQLVNSAQPLLVAEAAQAAQGLTSCILSTN